MNEHTRIAAMAAILLLSACAPAPSDPHENARGLLRAKLTQQCMATLPAGPQSTHYNDWSEVVDSCAQNAWYQANGCKSPELCLRELFPADKLPKPEVKNHGR